MKLRPYSANEMAVLVPTKDRPERVRRLLETLSAQTEKPGQVIIVDGGKSVEAVVRSFEDRLHVEWHLCHPPGQIRQRRHGLGKLAPFVRLVSLFDDDMVLEPDAVEQMVDLWNNCEPETAGIGYNLLNTTPHAYRRHYALFFMSAQEQGRVLPSGFVTPLGNVDKDQRVQWLGGGYTAWRRDVLDENPQEEINTKWAVGEDVRFSYPLGKRYPLYVCASARVREEAVNDYVPPSEIARYQGKKWALANLCFVAAHEDLSLAKCFWMLFGSTGFKLGVGILRGVPSARQGALGQLSAIWDFLLAAASGRDFKTLLED